ncbi:conserved hypothetical protein [Syntrophobacter sp. SbD1]|nr:conserved hypothetical protein [Syntrophobacter sp. SbD1]
MRVRIDEIPESGRTLRFHWDEERLAQFVPQGDPLNLKLLRPVNVVLNLNRHPDHLRITGNITGSLEVCCHRCLRPFELPLDEQVDIYLMADQRTPGDDEEELKPDELLYEFFDGEVIEVDRLVAEQIFLGLPVKVLCSENCKGICPKCGANLNEEVCRCKAADGDFRFAKLKLIKPGTSESAE